MKNRNAFTLIEVLVVVAIIALLTAILMPSLASAREAGRSSVCLTNLRQMFVACRMYADASRGYGPAIGVPYTALPNWALQVQTYYTHHGNTPTALYKSESVLVCPTLRSIYGNDMQRTYAMNAAGHAGLPADSGGDWPKDPDNFDSDQAHVRFDRVPFPARASLLVDSARAPVTPPQPPPVRTTSTIDFRQDTHVNARLAKPHRAGKAFNAGLLDGSSQLFRDVQAVWKHPFP